MKRAQGDKGLNTVTNQYHIMDKCYHGNFRKFAPLSHLLMIVWETQQISIPYHQQPTHCVPHKSNILPFFSTSYNNICSMMQYFVRLWDSS